MEPFIAVLLSVVLALVLGYRRVSDDKKVNHVDTNALRATYSEYLRAVSAAGLVRLSNFLGDPPAEEDIHESDNGPRLIDDMVGLLEGERADTVIEGLHGDNDPTVRSLLTRIADDAAKYWPDQISRVHRVRESLA
jgi:hypothetical protein